MAVFVGLPEPPEWMRHGLCTQVDAELFFPEKGGPVREAKLICRRCDVRAECLRWALDHDQHHGVWGGKSEKERRVLRRTERKDAA